MPLSLEPTNSWPAVGEDVLVRSFARRAAARPLRPALASRRGDTFVDSTAGDVLSQVVAVGKGLLGQSVAAGDRIALMGPSSATWFISDLAINAVGAVTVPIFDTSSTSQIDWILSNSEATAMIVTDDSLVARVPESFPRDRVWSASDEGRPQLVAKGEHVADHVVERRLDQLAASDIATIIYTSGTTGPPKGCVLTHGNLQVNVDQISRALGGEVDETDTTLIFLPLAHILSKTAALFCLHRNVRIAFASSIEALPEELPMVRPTLIAAVPRIFEKVHDKAHHRAVSSGRGRVFERSMDAAARWSRQRAAGSIGFTTRLEHAVFDRLVYSKVRDGFGGRLKMAFCGGAPLGERLTSIFDGVGIRIFEGYGLTETSPIITLSAGSSWKPGSVGRAVEGTPIKIAEDGEILVKGPQVFTGYWKNDQATSAAFDEDGWFKTGDVGEIDPDGFLRVTGRKKELIVTAGGKNVAPAPLEDQLRAHPLIGQAMVIGEGRPFIAALVSLDPDGYKDWLDERDRTDAPPSDRANDPELRAEVGRAVQRANESVSQAESIREFAIVDREFSIEEGELTPTLKIKRDVVAARHASVIDDLYRRRSPETMAGR